MKCTRCDGTGYRPLSNAVVPCEACDTGRALIEARRKRLERANKRRGVAPAAERIVKALDVVRHFQDREDS